MVGCLSNAGYEIVENPDKATFMIYNTCAVKTPTENRMICLLKRVPRNKKLIVTGCLPLINFERLKAEVEFDGAIGPSSGDRIIEVTRRVGSGERVVILGNNSKPSLDLPRIRVNKIISIVPINYGCLGACSYCCVRFARGQLRSYSIREIIGRIKCDLNSGVREVWLTSQDTACYGKDIGTDLISLLDAICRIDGEFFVRIGMMNPNYALDMLDDLVQVFKDDRVFKFIHLPVQSGDDQVLKLMNRLYSVADFEKIVYQFRKQIPEITLATDVICGFPGEDDAAFNRSLKLVVAIKPDVVNVSKFFPRPRSTAEKSRIPPREVKNRSKRIAELCNQISFEKNKKWTNSTVRILIDEEGKCPASWIGRNCAYKPTVIKSNEPLFGRFLNARITRAFATYLEAEIE